MYIIPVAHAVYPEYIAVCYHFDGFVHFALHARHMLSAQNMYYPHSSLSSVSTVRGGAGRRISCVLYALHILFFVNTACITLEMCIPCTLCFLFMIYILCILLSMRLRSNPYRICYIYTMYIMCLMLILHSMCILYTFRVLFLPRFSAHIKNPLRGFFLK